MAIDRAKEVQLHIAANLRRLRERRGLTQAAFATDAGFDARFLQRLEAGDVDMAISTLVRLSATLGVTPAALLRKATFKSRKPGRPVTLKRTP